MAARAGQAEVCFLCGWDQARSKRRPAAHLFSSPFCGAALGLGLARHLHAGAVIGDAAGWALQCVYAAKLAMLVLPEARLTVPLLGLLLAASPPLLLRGGGISRDHPGRDRPRRLRSWQGLGLAAAVLTAVAAARFAVFDIARFALDRWAGSSTSSIAYQQHRVQGRG